MEWVVRWSRFSKAGATVTYALGAATTAEAANRGHRENQTRANREQFRDPSRLLATSRARLNSEISRVPNLRAHFFHISLICFATCRQHSRGVARRAVRGLLPSSDFSCEW